MTEHDDCPGCSLIASNEAAVALCEGHCAPSSNIPRVARHRATAVESRTHDNNTVDTGLSAAMLPSSSSSMELNLIREEDADILEQGVEERSSSDLADFDEHGRRLEAKASDSSLIDAEEEAAVAAASAVKGDLRSVSNFSAGKIIDEAFSAPIACLRRAASGSLTSAATSSEDIDVISMPAIIEDSSHHTPHDPVTDKNSRPPQGTSVYVDQVEPLPEDNAGTSSRDIHHEALSRKNEHRRSGSYDRRMHESAQFAAAVGEESDSFLFKKILEEDSSSDFDDDEIDEGGNFTVEDEADGLVVGSTDMLQDIAMTADNISTEQLPETPLRESVEPRCVSTDLAKISLDQEGHSNPLDSDQGGALQQLSSTYDAGTGGCPTTMATPSGSKSKSPLHPPCYVNWKLTRANSFGTALDEKNARHKNGVHATSSGNSYFGYRGIPANPPVITKRGMARGNYALLHRKAWLEVTDRHHRYGKNLRMYYKQWEKLGHPCGMFFDWLDSTGEATGQPLPNLPEIPRKTLDTDTVYYITNPEISAKYVLNIVTDQNDGSAIVVKNGNPIHTGQEGWIFVLRDHLLYGSPKVTAPDSSTATGSSDVSQTGAGNNMHRHRFHHSSFFGGKAVASAGIFITNEQGRLTRLYPHSGHYRPGEAHMQRTLFFLQQLGVELSTFTVDMQQIFKVSRKIPPGAAAGKKVIGNKNNDKENNGLQINDQGLAKHLPPTQNTKKFKKTDCLHLMCGLEVACFLANKALMIERGVFRHIHDIRRVPKELRSSCLLYSESCQY